VAIGVGTKKALPLELVGKFVCGSQPETKEWKLLKRKYEEKAKR
jgi:hypothetical protein